eukprot:357274-Chlamydomonas_euryale.AAC.27
MACDAHDARLPQMKFWFVDCSHLCSQLTWTGYSASCNSRWNSCIASQRDEVEQPNQGVHTRHATDVPQWGAIIPMIDEEHNRNNRQRQTSKRKEHSDSPGKERAANEQPIQGSLVKSDGRKNGLTVHVEHGKKEALKARCSNPARQKRACSNPPRGLNPARPEWNRAKIPRMITIACSGLSLESASIAPR